MIAARCIGGDVRPPSGRTLAGRVAARYAHAAHLGLDDGRLLTLLSGDAQRGMRTVNLNPDDWPPLHALLVPGSSVAVDSAGIVLGGSRIDLARGEAWHSPPLAAGRRPPSILRARLGQARRWLDDELTGGRPPPLASWHAAHCRYRAVLAAFEASAVAFDAAVYATLGLGPGLTPSGDDMLGGLLLGLAGGGDVARRQRLRAAVLGHVRDASLTTRASRDGLDQACRGWLSAPLAAVLDALGRPAAAGASADPLSGALRAQASVGGHSGTDSLIGLLDGLALAVGTREGRPPTRDRQRNLQP